MSAITPEILLQAYAAGVFPMAERADDNALYWVEPDERGLFPLDGLHVSHSLRKLVRKRPFDIRIDHDFGGTMRECAKKTTDRPSTWINKRILSLYAELHRIGRAHSVECWTGEHLVGGLYGVSYGAAFFGESMFSRVPNASKVALVHLVARLNAGGFKLLDAQFINPHLETLGAVTVPKARYKQLLADALSGDGDFKLFRQDGNPEAVLRLAMPANPQPQSSRVFVANLILQIGNVRSLFDRWGRSIGIFAVDQPDVINRVLNSIEPRALRKHPAGKYPATFLVQSDLVNLHEGCRLGLFGYGPRKAYGRLHQQSSELLLFADLDLE